MKINIRKMLYCVLGIIISMLISYSIASVIILGNISVPFIFGNDTYFAKCYSGEQLVERMENFDVFSVSQFRAGTSSRAKIDINYENDRRDSFGYLLLDVDVISEENVDINVSITKSKKEKVTGKLNEGVNIFKIPLEDAKRIKIEFLNSLPVDMTINQLKVSNQLIGVLPSEWYLCFAICFLIVFEIICLYLSIELKFKKKVLSQIGKSTNYITDSIVKMYNFMLVHKKAFFVCFGICLFAYAYNLMNFSLGVDEERDIVRSIGTLVNVKELLLREGRYGLYAFRALETIDGSFTPFVGEILAVIFIFINIVVGIKGMDIVSKGNIKDSAIVVFGGMLATLPFVNAEIMCYSIMNAGVYFSMMLTTLALVCVASYYESKNKNKSKIVIALLFTVIAMMFLEAHNVWFITGTVLFNLVWVMANKNIKLLQWIKYVLHYVVVFVVAFIIYMVIRNVVGQNGYASNFIMWGTDEPIIIIKNVIDWITSMFTDESTPGAIYLLVSVVIFIGFIISYLIKEKGTRAGLILFLAICLTVAPFSLCFVAGNKMPFRTMESLLLLQAGAWFIIINFIDKKLIARYVLLASAVWIIWNQSVWMNRIFYGADINARLDMEMGYSIGEEIERVAGSRKVDKPVVFVGAYQHTTPNIYRIDAVGQSIFFRPRSIYKTYYMRYLGFSFQQPSNAQTNEANELATDMAVWPLEGSVKEFDDIIVVKLR